MKTAREPREFPAESSHAGGTGAGAMPLTRRDVLGTLGSSLAALPLLAAQPARSGSPGPPGKAVPRFAVRSPLIGRTLRERAQLAGRLGFEGIEIGGGEWFAPPVEEILRAIEGTGVRISAISALQNHLDPDAQVRRHSIEENKARLRKARQIGADAMVVVPVFGKESKLGDRRTEVQLTVAALRELAPVAEETGVKVVIEPLTRLETYFVNRLDQGEEIVGQVGSPFVGLLPDFYHMQMEEKDIPRALQTHIGRVFYVHTADGVARTAPGTLPFDYRPGFAVLKAHAYRGWITIEARPTPSEEVPATLTKSLAYLREQWAAA